jgi:hypothetical protein
MTNKFVELAKATNAYITSVGTHAPSLVCSLSTIFSKFNYEKVLLPIILVMAKTS